MTPPVRRRPGATRHPAGLVPPARTNAGSLAAIRPLDQTAIFNPDSHVLTGQVGVFNPDNPVPSGQGGTINPDRTSPAGQTTTFNPDRPSLLGKSETFGHTVFALVKENQHFSQKRLQNVKKCNKSRFPSPTPKSELPTPN